ncbi:MAG: hypothetical protein AAGF28_12875 [Pseudomonadota bacterium]
MSKAVFSVVVFLALTNLPTANATPKYDPYGVQNDVAVAEVLGGGWRILYQGLYSESLPSVPALFRGACDRVMLASKRVGSLTFDVLSAIETDVFAPLNTPLNTSIQSNGAQWYKNDQSLGFAGLGAAINQTSADTNGLEDRHRLSWHTIRLVDEPATRLNPGWRSGNNIRLDKSKEWERFVLTTTMPSSSAQSGQVNSCLHLG